MADKDDRGDPPNDESAADENQAAGEEGAIAEDGPEKTEKSSSRPKSGPATIAKFTYTEHADTVSRTAEEIEDFLSKNNIKLEGADLPRPILNLEETGFSEEFVTKLKEIFSGQPGPLPAYGLPVLLSGRDFVALGDAPMSERVLSFLPHLVMHCQRNMDGDGKGPLAMVAASNCRQVRDIYKYFRDAGRTYNLECLEISEETSNNRDDFQSEFHIAIGTVTVLQKVHSSGYFPFGCLSCVALYGVDELFDQGHQASLERLVKDTHVSRRIPILRAHSPLMGL